jgi:hypothetical protein
MKFTYRGLQGSAFVKQILLLIGRKIYLSSLILIQLKSIIEATSFGLYDQSLITIDSLCLHAQS